METHAARGAARRFYEETVLTYEGDDCLLWPFARYDYGYGKINDGGRTRRVHRLACEESHGQPPTPEHQAAHLCGNGHLGCVTKRHLAWKTRAENEADKVSHGTVLRGERNSRAKLTESDVREILSLKGSMTQAAIGGHFGVHQVTISKIFVGETWAHSA